MNCKISIKRNAHGGSNYCAYKGKYLFATIHGDKPTKTNGRPAHWNIAYLSGRVEWFDSFSEARDMVLKG